MMHIQDITVAVADADPARREWYEQLLQSEIGIKLLRNIKSSNEVGSDLVDRRLNPRTNIDPSEDEVARVKRLKPLVLLVNVDQCADQDYALLLSLRRECPWVKMILLADDSINERQIIQALEAGARGYLKYETVQLQLSMAIRGVGRGEAWVPRKILGSIMDHMLIGNRFVATT